MERSRFELYEEIRRPSAEKICKSNLQDWFRQFASNTLIACLEMVRTETI